MNGRPTACYPDLTPPGSHKALLSYTLAHGLRWVKGSFSHFHQAERLAQSASGLLTALKVLPGFMKRRDVDVQARRNRSRQTLHEPAGCTLRWVLTCGLRQLCRNQPGIFCQREGARSLLPRAVGRDPGRQAQSIRKASSFPWSSWCQVHRDVSSLKRKGSKLWLARCS